MFSKKNKLYLLPLLICLLLTSFGLVAFYFSDENRPFVLGIFNLLTQVGIVTIIFQFGVRLRKILVAYFVFYFILICLSWIQGFHPQFTILSFSQNALWIHYLILFLLISFIDIVSGRKLSISERLIFLLPLVLTGLYSSGRLNILLSIILMIPVFLWLIQQKKIILGTFVFAFLSLSLFLPSNMDGPRFTCANKCQHQKTLLLGFLGIEPYRHELKDLNKNKFVGFIEDAGDIGDFYYFDKKSLNSSRFEIWWHYVVNLNANTFLWGDNVSMPEFLSKGRRAYKPFAINHHNVLIQIHKISGIGGLIFFITLCFLGFVNLFGFEKFAAFLFSILFLRANTDTFLMYTSYTFIFLLIIVFALKRGRFSPRWIKND